jgi:hypothetical protein
MSVTLKVLSHRAVAVGLWRVFARQRELLLTWKGGRNRRSAEDQDIVKLIEYAGAYVSTLRQAAESAKRKRSSGGSINTNTC